MDAWQYETAADLDQPLLERLKSFPREPDMLVYGGRLAAATAMRAWLRAYHRLQIRGRENLPRSGSFVMVANHVSHLDALCLLAALPVGQIHRAFPAAAQDYFFVSVPRLAIATVVVNALPFQRESSIRQSLTVCRQLLETPDNVLIIFPEGTRSLTGELNEFKPGIGLVVAGTHHPVVPCYLRGAFEAWPKGAIFPRPRSVELIIGPPRCYDHLTRGKSAALEIAADLRQAVESLAASSTPDRHTCQEKV